FKFLGVYDNAFQYKEWNLVLYDNKTFVALEDVKGEVPSSSSKWQLVSSGYAWRGVYNSSSTYYVGEIVSDSDKYNLYISLKNNNTSSLTSTDNWAKIIETDEASRVSNESTRVQQEGQRVIDE